MPTGSSVTTEAFISYNNPDNHFSLQYPRNWNITEDQSGVWFTSPVDKSGNFRIEGQPANNRTLSDLVAIQLNQSKNDFKDFKIIRSNNITLAGITANLTDYSFTIEEQNLFATNSYNFIGMQISALKNNDLYTITYFSNPENFDIYLPTVQKMIESIKLT